MAPVRLARCALRSAGCASSLAASQPWGRTASSLVPSAACCVAGHAAWMG
jgi:hypothetical protein